MVLQNLTEIYWKLVFCILWNCQVEEILTFESVFEILVRETLYVLFCQIMLDQLGYTIWVSSNLYTIHKDVLDRWLAYFRALRRSCHWSTYCSPVRKASNFLKLFESSKYWFVRAMVFGGIDWTRICNYRNARESIKSVHQPDPE